LKVQDSFLHFFLDLWLYNHYIIYVDGENNMTAYQVYLDQMFDAMSKADQLKAVKQSVAKQSTTTWSDIAKLAKEIQ
jgi:hypothetical protein